MRILFHERENVIIRVSHNYNTVCQNAKLSNVRVVNGRLVVRTVLNENPRPQDCGLCKTRKSPRDGCNKNLSLLKIKVYREHFITKLMQGIFLPGDNISQAKKK